MEEWRAGWRGLEGKRVRGDLFSCVVYVGDGGYVGVVVCLVNCIVTLYLEYVEIARSVRSRLQRMRLLYEETARLVHSRLQLLTALDQTSGDSASMMMGETIVKYATETTSVHAMAAGVAHLRTENGSTRPPCCALCDPSRSACVQLASVGIAPRLQAVIQHVGQVYVNLEPGEDWIH